MRHPQDMNKPTLKELIIAIAHYYSVPEAVALSWLQSAMRDFNAKEQANALADRQGKEFQ